MDVYIFVPMRGEKIFLVGLFLLVCQLGISQNIRIFGKVTDRLTQETLVDAIVFVKGKNYNVLSNGKGEYALTVPKGEYTVVTSYLGYYQKEVKIKAMEDTQLNFELESNTELGEVTVSSQAQGERVNSVQMGLEKLSATEIKRMPALMGEVDVIKAIQLLPGVQTTSEGGSGFSVRGGSPDQNLILIDNTTLYNASHLFGFFSIFNNDALSGVSLYKGDIPLKHGGRLSSLLDVQTKTDQPEKFQGVGGIGLISSRLVLEGPIGEKTSWLIGGRRSYADLFLKLSSNESLRKSSVYFYDLNAKLTHRLTNKDRLELNGYYGKDNFGAEPGDFNYGNGAISLTWGHTFSEKLLSKVSINWSNYDYGLESKLDGSRATWESSITDWMVRLDFNQPLSDLFNLSYGATSTLHQFSPGIVKVQNLEGIQLDKNKSLEHSLYLSNEQKLTDWLSLKYGVRGSVFQNIGNATVYNYDDNYEPLDSTVYGSGVYNTYTAIEPRIGAVVKVSPSSSIKANFAHNVQFIQLANNSASGSPLDVWFTASPNIKPQKVNLFSVGYFHNLKDNEYEASVEVYYKDQKNVIDFAEHADLMMNDKLEGEVRTGTGKAAGAEFMIRKNSGRLTGFANYTLSRSERTIPEINGGKSYLAPYDKTHSLNIVANYEFSKKLSVSAVWIYATGNPTTYPSGRFEIDGEYYPIYSGRNEYRRPDYHRLDLSLTYVPRPDSKKRWKGEWNVSLFNAYNKKNPWMITYDQDADTGRPYAEMVYLFGIIPSITYNFKF
jgi:outer membrane receptor for ferrienterochelin and colicin